MARYAALTEAHWYEDAADLATDFFGSVRRLLPDQGVEEVKTIGDAVLLRRDEAAPAVGLGLRGVRQPGLIATSVA